MDERFAEKCRCFCNQAFALTPRPFTFEEERFILSQLAHPEDRASVKALQWLCERVREGFWFTDASKIRPSIKLCLFRESANAKRWAVNALAEIGAGKDIEPLIKLFPIAIDDPDLLSSLVSAVFSAKTDEEAMGVMKSQGIPFEGLALIAAAQFSVSQKQELVRTRIPLETEDAAVLRTAIVMAGKGKAPEHLFEARHTNAVALSELNTHHVPSVSKYSIWAITQLRLGFSSLILKPEEIEILPPQVRKWVFRLLISDGLALSKNLDLFSLLLKEPDSEVREEAAIELRDVFVEGLERYVSDWFQREEDGNIRALLADHMVAQNQRSSGYRDFVIDLYRKASPKSDERVRMEAASARTELFREFRKIDIEEERGALFAMNDNEGDKPSSGDTYNINQTVIADSVGALSGGGPIEAQTIAAVQQMEDRDQQAVLETVLGLFKRIADDDKRREAQTIVRDVAKEPSKNGWQKIIGFLSGVKEGSVAINGTAENAVELIETASKFL